jgi:K+-sensing histidine kinase KdpD
MKPTEHDLRAPLAAIEGYCHLLMESAADEIARRRLEGILSSCQIMAHLIANLRLAEDLAAGRIEVAPPGGQIGAILAKVASGFRGAFAAKEAAILVAADDVHLARGAAVVERIGACLLLAALNTSAHDRDVSLRATRAAQEWRIAISAEGFSGTGPGRCLELLDEFAVRLGGRTAVTADGFEVVIPESVLIEG